jgi:hypothetical protein
MCSSMNTPPGPPKSREPTFVTMVFTLRLFISGSIFFLLSVLPGIETNWWVLPVSAAMIIGGAWGLWAGVTRSNRGK